MVGPTETVNQLSAAINRGDLDAAMALYEPDAVLVAQPGQIVRGAARVREALAGFIALRPTLTTIAHYSIESGDLALYLGRWTLRGTDPTGAAVLLGGDSTDVLRRQPDGRWLIALDNPWGVTLLPQRE